MMDVANLLLSAVVSLVGSSCFAVILHCPKKQILYVGIVGMVGWVIYLLFRDFGVETASFFGSVGLCVLSRIFAYTRKSPVIIFIITGIFPLVPGAGIYSTGYNLFMGSTQEAIVIGFQTLAIAVAIALGMVVALTIPDKFFIFICKKIKMVGEV